VKVSSSIYAQEIGLINLSSSFALMLIPFNGPKVLQKTEYDYIKTLQDMGGMCRIADHQDLMHVSIFEEPMGII
jgi:hypothetical protein